MKHPIRRGSKPNPLTIEEIMYIEKYYKSKTALVIGIELKRSPKRVYEYLYSNNLVPFGTAGRQRKTPQEESAIFNVDTYKGEYTWVV